MTALKHTYLYAVSLFSLGSLFTASVVSPAFALAPAPAAQSPSVQEVREHWSGLEERLSFNKLSSQNLQALNAILDADVLITQHHSKEAEAKLSFAKQELAFSLKVPRNLTESASYIKKFHEVNPSFSWLSQYEAVNWAPVGGKFIARTKLSRKESHAIVKANDALKAGKVDLAYKAIASFQPKVQISIAIAPLEPTMKMVDTALQTLRNHNERAAHDILRAALDHYVFIPQNDLNVDIMVHNNASNMIASR